MTLADLQRTIEAARVVYQTEIAGETRHLVDVDGLTVSVEVPGSYDADAQARRDGWEIALGEEGDRGLAVGRGATLGAACEDLAAQVRARVERVQALLTEVSRG